MAVGSVGSLLPPPEGATGGGGSSSSSLVWVHFVSMACAGSLAEAVEAAGAAVIFSLISLVASMEVIANEAAATEVSRDAAECW